MGAGPTRVGIGKLLFQELDRPADKENKYEQSHWY
jgi:hypothetical protein